jgi:hypothetical protein
MLNISEIELYIWELMETILWELPIPMISKVNLYKRISFPLLSMLMMMLVGPSIMLLTVIITKKLPTSLISMMVPKFLSLLLPNTSILTTTPSSSVKINGTVLSLVLCTNGKSPSVTVLTEPTSMKIYTKIP